MRLKMSERDLDEAISFLQQHSDDQHPHLQRAIVAAAIVAYARPFTENSSGANNEAALRVGGWKSAIKSDEDRKLHKRVIDLRNAVVAHSAFDARPIRNLRPPQRETFLQWTSPGFELTEQVDLRTFLSLCTKMRSHFSWKMFDTNAILSEVEHTP